MTNKILYNVTVKILNERAEEWKQWMRETHIPDVMATKKFESYKISRILDDQDDGATFAIQYVSPSMDTFMEYQNQYAKPLQKEHAERYKNAYVAFRTLMEVLAES